MYRRFLNNDDYLSIITQDALSQLVRKNENRYIQAEQAAEASITDYLSENFEIERELEVGKRIQEYNRGISYPPGAYFYFEGQICEVIQAINGFKAPTMWTYWKEYEGDVDPKSIPPYSQLNNYQPGDLINYLGVVYICEIRNGFDFGDIRIPCANIWELATTYQWEAIPYNLWDVVEYEGQFFALVSTNDFDPLVNPMESDCWGLIGDYDNTIDTYEVSEHEYVVYQGTVYYPVVNPNADAPEFGKNIRLHDPRNYNLKKHMVQLALYELHKLISPNNISSVRVDDYEHSMLWLKDASRLKLNPQIPRKIDNKKEPLTDWQMATFQTSYDPYQNPWQV